MRLDPPVPQHDGHEHLVVVQHEVVDAGGRDRRRVRGEVGDADARHLERAHLAFDRAHRVADGSISSAADTRSR